MKKISTLAMLLIMGAMSAWSQTENVFYFVDQNGKEVPDGTELTITETEEGVFGEVIMKTGLSIKSRQSGTVYGSIVYHVIEMSNGAFQVCFPANCTSTGKTEEVETPAGEVKTEDIQAEWIPDAFGTAKVTLQPKTYKHNNVTGATTFVADGPKITLNFVYSDHAGIMNAEAGEKKEIGRYTLDGRKLEQPENGINIVKTNDGKTQKVFIKK